MVARTTSAYLARHLCPHTIYSLGPSRRGIDLRVEVGSPSPLPGMRYLELEALPASGADGKLVKELVLPTECLMISVRRKDSAIMARGDTLIRAGDRLSVACARSCEGTLRRLMEQSP